MPEWQKRRTSAWRRAAWSWREAAAAHAKKNLNSVTYVSPKHSFVFPVSRIVYLHFVFHRPRARVTPAFQNLKGR